jgi:sulfate transport system ATP-binding protein
VGFVFQHYALFRHMTIFENVAFSLRVRPPNARPSEEEIRSRVHELLRLVQLDWLSDRYPSQLSGGQRQRVALARALAVKPKVLLLDEPFGSLDAKVRQELRRWLRRLHDEIHVTSVFVTHDQEEAMEVADRIVVINEGQVIQTGTPEEVYDHPATAFVYQFLGNINMLRGRIQKGRLRVGGAEIKAPDDSKTQKGAVVVYVRPHEIELVRATRNPAAIEVTVREVYAVGPTARLELALKTGGDRIEAVLAKERHKKLSPRKGDRLFATLRNIRIFPGNAPS